MSILDYLQSTIKAMLIFSHVKFKETHLPNGTAMDDVAECTRYDQVLTDQAQLLGNGTNGHIAFNEPRRII